MRRPLLIVLAVSFLAVAGGCKTPSTAHAHPSPEVRLPPAATIDGPADPATDWTYWEVDELDAETVLVATLRSAGGEARYDVPLKRFRPGQSPGILIVEHVGVACGGAARLAEHTTFAVTDDAGPGVTIRVSAVPASLPGMLFAVGGARRSLTVPVGLRSDHRLATDVTLRVEFRTPERRAAAGGPQDPRAWERHLEWEREYADIPPLRTRDGRD